MSDFFMEIGTEELPSRFLREEEKELASRFEEALRTRNLDFNEIEVYSTPRRCAIAIKGLPQTQPASEETALGPARVIAHDAEGKPTRALLGFLKGRGASLDDVFFERTPKGEYAAVKLKKGGRKTSEILAEICPEIISSLPFPKSMRWGSRALTYARPVRWIVALLDDEIVNFSLEDLQSGKISRGHRVHGEERIEIDKGGEYERIMEEKGGVIVDAKRRGQIIRERGDALAREVGGEIVWKDALLDEVTGLVERPEPMLGKFDPAFLELPEEVLLTSMESHQKSFGVRRADGLAPYFLTTLNIDPPSGELVRAGWERVLRARLEDARFFWRSDLETGFEEWLKKLEAAVFIGALGSMGDKSRRLEKLCGWLAGETTPPLNEKEAELAGKLAKADLVSGMVGEFDTLQGIMGGIYAIKAGYSTVVGQAIREQYLPAGPDTPMPQSPLGVILSMADKADTLAGCFGLGIIPTGMADSYGLRRCALGIIRILLAREIRLSIERLMSEALDGYGKINWKFSREDTIAKLMEFFRGRIKNYFQSLGYDTTLVDAALASGFYDLPDLAARIKAVAEFKKDADFEKLAQILKRAHNIAIKEKDVGEEWREALLVEEAEKTLSETLKNVLPLVAEDEREGRYGEALKRLKDLLAPVNGFFENVMALCEDADLRVNRLRMLRAIVRTYAKIADFTRLGA